MLPATCPAEEALVPLVTGDLVEDEVRQHVAECPDCRRRLERMRAELTSLRDLLGGLNTVAQPGTPIKTASRPAMVGKYLIVGTLGEGGQATVYRGLNPDLNVEVVIKLERAAVEGEPSLLINEGRLLSSLKHPNLAQVYDLCTHDGQPFLVMEYVRGSTLEQFAWERKWHEQPEPQEAALLVAKVARALTVAHAQKVYHQDVKPRNIMIDETGEPRLIDFGLARLRRGVEGPVVMGGTPAYMAPEQARGEADRIGAHTDIYSLGGVLYFLLTGKPPFGGKDGLEARQRAMRGEFDREALKGVPKKLALICLKALEPHPSRRYASTDELAEALERFARPPALSRRLLVAAVAAGVVVAAGLTWAFWPTTKPVGLPTDQQVVQVSREVRGRAQVSTRLEVALPLRGGDGLQIDLQLPAGLREMVVRRSVTDHVEELGPSKKYAAGNLERLLCPAENVVRVSENESGLELILVVANGPNRPEPNRDDLRHLLGEVGLTGKNQPDWKQLPPDVLLRLEMTDDNSGVKMVQKTEPRGTYEPPPPIVSLKSRLLELRGKLKERYDFYAGVALPVKQPERVTDR